MARSVAELPKGQRITDYISFGVIERAFPLKKVEEVLKRTGKASQRERDLPAHIMVYYAIALALYMGSSCREVLRCLLSGRNWLRGLSPRARIVGKSGISQARSRLGQAPVKALHDELVGPIATSETKGAWYRDWRLVSLDEILDERVVSSRGTRNPRAVRRNVGRYPIKHRCSRGGRRNDTRCVIKTIK